MHIFASFVPVIRSWAELIALGLMHMVLHELGHVLAAFAVGSKVQQIGIGKLGPFIRRSPASTPTRNAAVALAGPGINILTWLLLAACGVPDAWVALYVGTFNLLPLPNSDLTQCLRYLKIKALPAES